LKKCFFFFFFFFFFFLACAAGFMVLENGISTGRLQRGLGGALEDGSGKYPGK
jgi:hypothetical protein